MTPTVSTQARTLAELAGVPEFANPRPLRARAPIVAVTGGKGGVGKSTIASNLAIAIANAVGRRLAPKVLLVDLDLGLASLDAILGLPRGRHLGDALEQRADFDSTIVRGPGGIEVLPAPRGFAQFAALEPAQRDHLLHHLRRLCRARDAAILDLPAGIHPDGLAFTQAADFTLVVATPEPASLADAYAVVKLALERSPLARIGFVVNGPAGPVEARQLAERFAAVVQRFLGRPVESLGWIPRDPAIGRAIAARRPVFLSETTSASAAAFRLLAARVDAVLADLRSQWEGEASSLGA
ncbi:MAG: P-loop NTPase [Planctomycetes bacterium]|nr:P-loop NTPase [Planctomycetota bacterium]